MAFALTYDLEGAGWGMARISDGEAVFDITISYLHDTLGELADASIALRDGADSARVLFMDEPGEVHLILRRLGDTCLSYELRWFDDWNSWGITPDDQFTIINIGETTITIFLAEVIRQLTALLEQHGAAGYREKWIEHDFPSKQLDALVSFKS